MKIKKSVYTQSFEYARKNGELERYHESNKLNQQCASAIYNTIVESNYAPNHYDLESVARKMIDEYGSKRVAWLLANTVQQSHNDGRYSSSNKEWAKAFEIPADSGRYCTVRSHPCLVDGLIDAARIEIKSRDLAASLARAAKREAKRSLSDEVKNKLEKIVEYLIESGAKNTSSGNFIIEPKELEPDFMGLESISEYTHTIAKMMLEYSAVAEADVLPDGSLDVLMYLAYCPNFEPDPAEADEYPPDREILDPLKTKRVPESEPQPIPAVKPTLAEKLEANKRKAAQQGQSGTSKHDKNREV